MADSYVPIGYTYDTLYAKVVQKLKTKSEWTDISEEDTLLKLLCTILTTKEMGIFATINNTFIDYFPNVGSAEELVYMFADYIKMTINYLESATTTIRFSLASAYAKNIIFPANLEVATSNNSIIFSNLIASTLNAGDLTIDLSFVQGQWKDIENISDGTSYQKYYIYEDIDVERLLVYVNDVLWTKVDTFFDSTDDDKHYMVKKIKDGLYVLFNDGKFGMKPSAGDEVKLTYLQSLGVDGNIYALGLLTSIMSNVYDTDGTDVTDLLTATNTLVATDGYDGDDITTIQGNISTFFKTNPYLLIKDDYKSYLKAHALVRDVNVYAGWEVYPDTYQNWFEGVLYVVPKNAENLTEAEKIILYDYIKLQDPFFTNFEFQDVKYIGNFLSISLKFNDTNPTQVTINEVTSQIATLIEDYYDLELAVEDYGTVFRDIYRSVLEKMILDEVDEIMKINISIQSVEEVDTVDENVTLFNAYLDYQDIKVSGTYLYIGTENVGTFNSSWVLVPNDNSSTGGINWVGKISSTITYAVRYLTINILDPNLVDSDYVGNIVGDIIYIRSDSLDDNDIYEDASGNMVFEYFGHEIEDLGL
jgi:hypothetical protein